MPNVPILVFLTTAGPEIKFALVVDNAASVALVIFAPNNVFRALYSVDVIGTKDISAEALYAAKLVDNFELKSTRYSALEMLQPPIVVAVNE